MKRKLSYGALKQRIVELEQEVAELKITKEQFRETNALLEKTLASLTEAVLVIDPSDRSIIACNPAVEEVFGYSAGETVGGDIEDLHVNREMYEEFRAKLLPALETAGVYHTEYQMRRKDGSVFLSERTVTAVADDSGERTRLVSLVRDITDREQAMEALRETNELLEKIFSTTHLSIAYLDPDFNFMHVNRAYAAAGGHDEAFFVGKNHFDLYPHPENEAIFRRVVETGEAYSTLAKPFEYPDQRELGVTYWDWTLHPVKDNTGAVEGLLLCLLDVTERIRGEKALHETKRLLESTLASLADAVFVVEPSSRRIIACNPALERVFGYTEKEVVGRNTEFLHVNRNMYEQFGRELLHALDTKGVYHTEYKLRRKDGSVFFSENIVTAIVDDSGNRTGLVSFVRDITERKEAEEALKRLEEQRRYLSTRLLETQETERRHVANELHDNIGSSLAGIKMALELKLKAMQKGAGTSEAIDLETIIARAKEVMEKTKRIEKNLRPLVLDNLGLIPAIGSLCREFEQTHPDIAISPNLELDEEVSESLRIAIYRICQEALNNIARHSGAKAASLSLTKRSSNIELVVSDEGHGFDTEKALRAGEVHQGIGLFSMKERCELAGGSFSLFSSIGEGTTVSACWPCT